MKLFIVAAFITVTGAGCAKKITQTAVPVPEKPTPAVIAPKPPAPPMVMMENPHIIAGREIYTTKCTRCHPAGKTEDFTVAQWEPIINRMAPKARLDSMQKADVLEYVSTYAKKS